MSLLTALSSFLKKGNPQDKRKSRKKSAPVVRESGLLNESPTESLADQEQQVQSQDIPRIPNSLQFVTHDEFYPEQRVLPIEVFSPKASSILGPPPPFLALNSSLRQIIPVLDIKRITNRIIVSGLLVNTPSLKEKNQVNIDDVATFMDRRYNGRYMVWNLAGGTAPGQYPIEALRNQVLRFPFAKAYQLNLKIIFDICRSIHAWLAIDDRNVVLLHCMNGIGRSGIAIACYLRYAQYFQDTQDAFDYFCDRRTPEDISWVTVSQKRYITYFNNILLMNGAIPNAFPLKVHRVILNSVPNFDNMGSCIPGIEIYQCGRLVYSMTCDTDKCHDEDSIVYMDAHNVIFRIPDHHFLQLDKDIQVRIFHCPDPLKSPTNLITMVNFSFHTGYMPSGVIEVISDDLEISKRDKLESRFDEDFSVAFVFSEAASKEQIDKGEVRAVTYHKLLDMDFEKCLSKIVRYHCVKVIDASASSLEQIGCHRLLGTILRSMIYSLASFALQRTNNVMNAAYEYLSYLLKGSVDAQQLIRTLHKASNSTKANIEATKAVVSPGSNQSPSFETFSPSQVVFEDSENMDTKSISSRSVIKSPTKAQTTDYRASLALNERIAQREVNASLNRILPSQNTFIQRERNQNALFSILGQLKSRKSTLNQRYLETEEKGSVLGYSERGTIKSKRDSSMDDLLAELDESILDLHENTGELSSYQNRKFSAESLVEERSDNGLGGHPWIDMLHQIDNIAINDESEISTRSLDDISLQHEFSGRLRDVDTSRSRQDTGGSRSTSSLSLLNSRRYPSTINNLISRRNSESASLIHSGSGSFIGPRKRSMTGSLAPSTEVLPAHTLLSPIVLPVIPDETVTEPPPPPPPLPTAAIPPPPPPSVTSPPPPPGMPDVIDKPGEEQKSRMMAKLHWKEIRNIKALQNSIWTDIAHGDKIIPETPQKKRLGSGIAVDVKRFEELFCAPPDGKLEKIKPQLVLRKQFKNILDLRRANNVSISLSRFTRRGLTYATIIEAVKNMDETKLQTDDLIALQKLLPTFEEKLLLQKHLLEPVNPNDNQLGSAEQFMIQLLDEPDFGQMIISFIFKVQSDVEINDLTIKCHKMTRCCELLKSSDALKQILKAVLELGNMTNYQYGAGQTRQTAKGFKIEGLAKLRDVKSSDKSWSLMNFLVDLMEKSKKDVLDAPSQISKEMKMVKNYDLREIMKQLKALETTIVHLKKYNFTTESFRIQLTPFLDEAEILIAELRQDFVELGVLWTETATYFGEDLDEYNPFFLPATQQEYNHSKKMPTQIFITLDQFFQSFEEALLQNKRKAMEEEKKKAREREKSKRLLKKDGIIESETLDSNETKNMVKRFSQLISEPDEAHDFPVTTQQKQPPHEENLEY